MAVYLTFVKSILEKRENAIKSADTVDSRAGTYRGGPSCSSAGTAIFLVNEHQSTHLWRVIQTVYNYLSSSQLPCNKRHKYCPKIFKEFSILVTRAYAIFVQELSFEHNWLQAAIIYEDHGQVYKELSLDLQACVELFHENTGHPIPVKDSAVIKEAGSLQFWCTYAQLDKAELRNRLKDLVAQPVLDEKERLLAEYLLQREKRNDVNQDDLLPQFYRVKCRYPDSGKCIGQGAFGAVYEVNWLGMTCAKKRFHGPINEEFLEECTKEVNILAKLNHPHIVKLLCTSVTSEISFLMEFMPMSLLEFIRNRCQSFMQGGKFIVLSAAIDMMLQIARGMEFLHEQGVVHRDLKSSNILVAPLKISKLCDEGYADVKLTDFGLAKMKVNGVMKPTRRKMGTTQWMAPEAFGADEEIDWKKADVYSFAMTCSEILMGKIPYKCCPLLGKLCARIKKGERPELPPSCPEDLASLLKACWDNQPSSRPSFTEIIRALTSVKNNFLRLRWDGIDCVRSPHSSTPPHLRGFRVVAYVDPILSSLEFSYSGEQLQQLQQLGLDFRSSSRSDSIENRD